MSDWTMQPRTAQEQQLHIAGYRITYNSALMYETKQPDYDRNGERPWIYYGASLEDAWTAAYKHNQNRGDVPLGLLEICLEMVAMHDRDEYPSPEFSHKLIEMRDWLKLNGYL